MSACCASLGVYSIFILPFFTFSHTKLYLKSICLTLRLFSGVLTNAMHAWLASNICIQSHTTLRSSNSFLNYNTSTTELHKATNSASAVDNPTLFCFLVIHDTVFPKTLIAYPDTDLLLFTSLPQSEST